MPYQPVDRKGEVRREKRPESYKIAQIFQPPHVHDHLFPRMEERDDHVPEKKGNEQRNTSFGCLFPGIIPAHEIACQNQEECHAAIKNRQFEQAGEREGRRVDAHDQACREEPGYVNPVFPG